MKKIATISFAAALMVLACLVSSCEKSGVQSGIGFKVTCASTKGVEITTASLKAAPYGEFVWDGFYPTSNTAAYARKSAEWKDDMNVYYTGEFWPTDESQPLDFWCYAPVSQWAAAPSYTNNHTNATFSFTPSSGSDSDAVNQSDLLVAYGGQMTYNQAGHTDHRVPLTFRHPLCGIKFKVGDLTEVSHPDKVQINSVTINGVKLSGSCVATKTSDSECSFAWTPSATTGSYKQTFPWALGTYATTGQVLNTLIDNAFFMIVPQTLTSTNSITVEWSIAGIVQPAKTATFNTTGINLEAGMIYTFNLVIKSDVLVLGVFIDPWYEEHISI